MPYFWPVLALSLLIHILFLFKFSETRTPLIVEESSRIVSIISPDQLISARKQMVEDTKQAPEEPKIPTKLESSENMATEKEQVKRGNLGSQSPQQNKQPPSIEKQATTKREEITKPAQPQEKFEPSKASPKDLVLKLDENTLKETFAENQKKSPQQERVKPFSRPSGQGAAFFGSAGTVDYLPDLPDGDVTLLNAKANTFAVFVRRVALAVFAELQSSGWSQLSSSDIKRMNGATEVRAVLSLEGKLLKVEVRQSSGSAPFDKILASAVQKAAKDPNPPKAAAADDGNIRFIFQAQSWSEVVLNNKTGFPIERRWLLLGTGLE